MNQELISGILNQFRIQIQLLLGNRVNKLLEWYNIIQIASAFIFLNIHHLNSFTGSDNIKPAMAFKSKFKPSLCVNRLRHIRLGGSSGIGQIHSFSYLVYQIGGI